MRLPCCKIHLDFHNSVHLKRIGEAFDPDEFGDTLKGAGVDAVVLFAKDMHGLFYYPSANGPVHPGLSFDLLGAQVEACRARGIATYGYYCSLWDQYLAETHPEWRMVKRDGTTYMPGPDETPYWPCLCGAHEEVVRLMEGHTEEILTRYALDGIWFDMPIPRDGECFCPLCLQQMRSARLDPYDTPSQRSWQHATHVRFLTRLHDAAQRARPGCQVDFNNQGAFRLPERLASMQSVDIEALPTAQWGYDYFPAVVRYARTAGARTYGMTGRFHGSWADFGGLKEPHQLVTESLAIVAQGAAVDVGDQMPPSGRLDPAVYDAIGTAFAQVHAIEPYLEGAVPVAECVVLADGLPLDSVATASTSGWVKVLQQLHIQCDVAESSWDWSGYRLVIVTPECPFDPSLASRLETHMNEGGAVLIANPAWGNWLESRGLGTWRKSAFQPAYFLPSDSMPAYEYAIYGPSWTMSSPTSVVATLGEPLFQRSPGHYTSHEQTPFDHDTGFAVAGCDGPLGFIGFDAGELFLATGYWAYRDLLRQTIDAVLPERMIRSDAGPTVQIEVTHQEACESHPERFLIHLVHWEVQRPSAKHPPYLAKPPRIGPIHLRFEVGRPISGVRAVRLGEELPLTGDGYCLTEMTGGEILVFEMSSV